ncbi:MAG TPA: hypothetical protein VGT61_04015 [Thermomicrobiales bacterium]|jgi:hypothetical protein|nr:hypothetical protein [Thermomicrobiales bacterium]
MEDSGTTARRSTGTAGGIVIIGTCASGKSTLADNLRTLGYDAQVVAQEHSDIGQLWARTGPSVVIALESSLETIRSRRGPRWSSTVYERQRRRLAPAMHAATVVIDTGTTSPMATLAAAASAIRAAGVLPGSAPGRSPASPS